MHASTSGRVGTGARLPRRLARRVLLPLLACGLVFVAAGAAVATVVARDAARSGIDSRAEALHVTAASALRRSGTPGASAALTRAAGGRLHVSPLDVPLPGGRSIRNDGPLRVYTYSAGSHRLEIALPAAPVAAATRRALTLSLGVGLALLLFTMLAVASALRRAATRPLHELAHAVERMAAGEAPHFTAAGTGEIATVGYRLASVAARLAELDAQATTDPLTGLANRRSFGAALETELKRASRDGRSLALVLIDLDGFKGINDSHGHPFGDGVLQLVAEKMTASMRATDIVARVGGDEFAILLPATDRDGAVALVERAREDAAGAVGGAELSWSAGVAAFPEDAGDSTTLVECADVALYCAKAGGTSSVCVYDPAGSAEGSSAAAGDRAAVELLLSAPDGVVPVFQPLVSLSTGRVVGYEALARFPHPPARRPDEWFAIAGRCGLGHQLERRAMEAALAPANRPTGTYLSFNLSASALMSDEVRAALPHDLDGIVIELTEHEDLDDLGALAATLTGLRARGARIAIDDAGSGYLGLQQVMHIEPDLIKLDRSLVANVDSDPAKAALVDSFVRFAARTGSSVCAEGVETPDELRMLAELEVAYVQGFGISRPAPPWAEVAPWVPGTLRATAA